MAQRSDTKTIPNLYQLLGLSGPESSPEEVERAIVKLRKKATALKEKKDRRSAGAEQLVRVATKQLTNPEQRRLYDKAWTKQFSEARVVKAQESEVQDKVVAAVVDAQTNTTNSPNSRLLELLPRESPEAAFDLAVYLAQTPAEESDDSEHEFAAIMNRLSGNVSPQLTASRPPALPAKQSPPGISNKLRRKKKGNLLLPAIGLVTCTAAVLGLIAFLVNSPPGEENQLADASDTQSLKPQDPAPSPPPQRSGLPQVSGLGGNLGNSDPTGMAVQPMTGGAGQGGMQGAGQQNSDMQDSGMPANDGFPVGDSKPDVGMMPTNNPPNDASNTQTQSQTPAKPDEPSPEPLTQEAKQLFVSVCEESIQLLGDYSYDEAREKLDQLLELPLPAEEMGQASRLRRLADYAQRGFEALQKAIRDMGPGEVFTVGTSTQVAFVDAANQSITVKLGPRPKTYEYSELPPGILYSLFDLALDRENQTALAQRSAFILFQPNRNARSLEKSQELMTQAIVSSNIPEDLVEVFTDPWFAQ